MGEAEERHVTHASLVWECGRAATYTSWPFDSGRKCNAAKMAEAGFFRTEDEEDSVRCFLCGKEMVGWEEDNDPWEEHVLHAPKCLFAQIRKPECDLTVAEFMSIMKQFHANSLIARDDKVTKLLDETIQKYINKIKITK